MGVKSKFTCKQCGYKVCCEGGGGGGMMPESRCQTCYCVNCKDLFDRRDVEPFHRMQRCKKCNGELVDWNWTTDPCPKCGGEMEGVTAILWD